MCTHAWGINVLDKQRNKLQLALSLSLFHSSLSLSLVLLRADTRSVLNGNALRPSTNDRAHAADAAPDPVPGQRCRRHQCPRPDYAPTAASAPDVPARRMMRPTVTVCWHWMCVDGVAAAAAGRALPAMSCVVPAMANCCWHPDTPRDWSAPDYAASQSNPPWHSNRSYRRWSMNLGAWHLWVCPAGRRCCHSTCCCCISSANCGTCCHLQAAPPVAAAPSAAAADVAATVAAADSWAHVAQMASWLDVPQARIYSWPADCVSCDWSTWASPHTIPVCLMLLAEQALLLLLLVMLLTAHRIHSPPHWDWHSNWDCCNRRAAPRAPATRWNCLRPLRVCVDVRRHSRPSVAHVGEVCASAAAAVHHSLLFATLAALAVEVAVAMAIVALLAPRTADSHSNPADDDCSRMNNPDTICSHARRQSSAPADKESNSILH